MPDNVYEVININYKIKITGVMFNFSSITPVIICLKRIDEGVVRIVKFKIS